MTKIQWLKGYYLLLGYVTFTFGFKRFSSLNEPPASWIPGLDIQALGLVLILLVLGLALACVFKPENAWLKRFLFLFFFAFEIQFNLVGAPTHLYQFWLWSSLALALMPQLNKENNRHLDLGIRTCISIILLMYFFSGFWKTIGAFEQIFAHEPHLFSSQGLIYHIYSEIIRAGAKPLLLPFLTKNSFINPILGLGVVGLQLACFVGIFKTSWHRYLGIGILLFHVGTALILDITYPTNFLLVLWCLILSPFAQPLEYRVADTDELS